LVFGIVFLLIVAAMLVVISGLLHTS